MNPGARMAAAVAVLLLGGCITVGLSAEGKHPELHRHMLDGASGVTPRPGHCPAVAVRGFGGRARYDDHVVMRSSADDVVRLEFDRWGDPPADAATDAVREGLAASGAFAFVSSAGDALSVERYLDGYVLGFDLLKTASGPWKAHFAARLSLSDREGRMLHSAVYETTHDLPGASAAGLGPAMSAAVGDAVNRALTAWAAAGLLK